MQIGGLGFIQSIAHSNNMEQVSGGGAFASLLSNVSQSIISDDNLTTLNKEEQAPSDDLLKELIQMINTTDLSELNFVQEHAVSFTDKEEIMQFIQNALKIDESDLKSTLSTFLKSLNLEKDGSGPLDKEITNLIEELPKMETDESFMAFIQLLPLIQMDQITIKNDEQFSGLVKSLKLFDLLSGFTNSDGNNIQLKKFLQKIGEKLELQIKPDRSFNQKEILYKVFTPVVKGLQNQTLINQPIQLETKISDPLISGAGFHDDGLSFQQMSKPEQLLILNSQTGKQVSVEQLIKQFEAILSKSQFTQAGGNQRLFIKLYPEHLGALRVELIQQETGIIAKLMTSTTTAKEILESQLQSLKQAFSSQNIQIERIEISNQLNNPERFINKDPEQQEQRNPQEQEERKQEPEQSFTMTLEETLLNIEV